MYRVILASTKPNISEFRRRLVVAFRRFIEMPGHELYVTLGSILRSTELF